MSDGAVDALTFFLVLSGWIFVIWVSLRAVKRRVTRWDPNSYTWFIISFGSFGQRQIDNWKRWGGYDEDQAKIIIKYQALCWFGMILWGLASMAISIGYTALTHEDGRKVRSEQQPEHYQVAEINDVD